MLHIEKITILLLQFAQNRKSISLKLRPQEEVKNGSLKKHSLFRYPSHRVSYIHNVFDIHYNGLLSDRPRTLCRQKQQM